MKKSLIRIYKKLFRINDKIVEAYNKKDYLDAYSDHTDARIEIDPHAAIGGNWEEIGKLQFEFLKNQGLNCTNNFLDLGCGTLRGGRHFITYLNQSKYVGIDISAKAIEYAQKLLLEEKLNDKQVTLLINETKSLKFDQFNGQKFDFILAQSVFTHLKPEHIEECFAHISKIMNDGSCFYFTYFKSSKYEQMSYKDFSYPISFFENLSKKHNFILSDYTSSYNHPSNQNMLSIRKFS